MTTIKLLNIARTRAQQERGLQNVRTLPDGTGMLFDFATPRVLSFWMSNTPLPLDIAFISDDGTIVKTESMVPYSLKSVSSGTPCTMAIECPQGTFDKHGIKAGHKVEINPFLMNASFKEDRE